ncbi:hypothetical protein OIU84_025835 [Salix udensis]|uniref:Uncharacterized protein n=1 Tax=Salix udensis TaxID=889485 RepID=A0AAD6KKG5_9ROSI|nr:hypothetical protein OIU84_025835 [Salix udensis]
MVCENMNIAVGLLSFIILVFCSQTRNTNFCIDLKRCQPQLKLFCHVLDLEILYPANILIQTYSTQRELSLIHHIKFTDQVQTTIPCVILSKYKQAGLCREFTSGPELGQTHHPKMSVCVELYILRKPGQCISNCYVQA